MQADDQQSTPEQEESTSAVTGQPILSRRTLLKSLAVGGVGTLAFQRALTARVVAAGTVTPQMIEEAQWIAGLELDEKDRSSTASRVQRALNQFDAIRDVDVDYSVPPALHFHVAPQQPAFNGPLGSVAPSEEVAPALPDSPEQLAFMPLTELAALIRTRKISSMELTRLYLGRLEKYDPLLKCVVTLTPETALEQAARADAEIAAGRYRGALHGIPWGAKDLIAYPAYPTTWGAPQFKDRILNAKATVAAKLDQVGAVLVAKLALGALAMGDKWYGGPTKNPWNPAQGSSGSSAGSASATAAGCVGFSLGSETLGSIMSPSRRCGVTGLRPTFGRVSRQGCMSLSWSMDKLGPICRSAEDCALVFQAIHGADGLDPSAVDRPFHWPVKVNMKRISVGYVDDGTATALALPGAELDGVEVFEREVHDPLDSFVRNPIEVWVSGLENIHLVGQFCLS